MGAYQNPLRAIKNLVAERVDQGVDYSGSGPIYAIGPGVIENVYNSGWPGGVFISERLTSGPDIGKYVYYAEGIQPSVKKGQKVNTSSVIGHMNGGIEIGWAAAPGTGDSEAMANNEQAPGADPGAWSTAYGANFNNLLKNLGAPPGKVSSTIHGKASGSYVDSSTGTNSTGSADVGGNGAGDIQTTGLGISLNPFPAIMSALGISDLPDLLERGALILLGALLIIVGIVRFTDAGKQLPGAANFQQAKQTGETTANTEMKATEGESISAADAAAVA